MRWEAEPLMPQELRCAAIDSDLYSRHTLPGRRRIVLKSVADTDDMMVCKRRL